MGNYQQCCAACREGKAPPVIKEIEDDVDECKKKEQLLSSRCSTPTRDAESPRREEIQTAPKLSAIAPYGGGPLPRESPSTETLDSPFKGSSSFAALKGSIGQQAEERKQPSIVEPPPLIKEADEEGSFFEYEQGAEDDNIDLVQCGLKTVPVLSEEEKINEPAPITPVRAEEEAGPVLLARRQSSLKKSRRFSQGWFTKLQEHLEAHPTGAEKFDPSSSNNHEASLPSINMSSDRLSSQGHKKEEQEMKRYKEELKQLAQKQDQGHWREAGSTRFQPHYVPSRPELSKPAKTARVPPSSVSARRRQQADRHSDPLHPPEGLKTVPRQIGRSPITQRRPFY